MNTVVKSALRVLDMLDVFTLSDAPLGVSEVARQLGIPKSSAHGLLATLESRGYVAREGSLFSLAPELRFGNGLVEGPLARLIHIAEPVMRRIADASGESALLSVLTHDRRHIKYVTKAVSPNEVRYDAQLTYERPAYATSSGIVMMAYRPPAEVQEFLSASSFEAITGRTITGRQQMKLAIARAKRDGIAESSDANVAGASGISAPVLGRDGFAMAAVSLVAPSGRFKESRKLMHQQVRAAASDLTRMMRGESELTLSRVNTR